MASKTNALNLQASRPAEDRLEVRLDNEPDTPMHHAHRGLMTGASRYKLIRWARIVMVFLLVVVTVAWLFVDIEDLNIRQRYRSRRGGRIMNELPEHMSSDANFEHRMDALMGEEDFGLGSEEDAEDDSPLQISHRERWIHVLEPRPVQPRIWVPDHVDKSFPIVILMPQCCETEVLSDEEVSSCHQHIMQRCTAHDLDKCFQNAVEHPVCGSYSFGQPNHHLTYFAGLLRVSNFLEELHWTNVQIHYSPIANDSNPSNTLHQQKAREALQQAKLIIVEAEEIPKITQHYPQALFIAIDGSQSATMPQHLGRVTESERIQAIWRATIVNDADADVDPLIQDLRKIAFQAQSGGSASNEPEDGLPADSLSKAAPLLSHAFRYRYPLDCGGNLQHLRFVGAFSQNFTYWSPPRLTQRSIDVAFIARNLTAAWKQRIGSVSALDHLNRHTDRLKVALRDFEAASDSKVLVRGDDFKSYGDFLQLLQQVKILIVPAEVAEVDDLDFEAILSGCLLVKVDPASFQAYPDIFKAEERILGSPSDWHGLQDTLTSALQDMEHSQRMADRAYHSLLEMSDLRRYAADIDQHLSSIVRAVSSTAKQ